MRAGIGPQERTRIDPGAGSRVPPGSMQNEIDVPARLPAIRSLRANDLEGFPRRDDRAIRTDGRMIDVDTRSGARGGDHLWRAPGGPGGPGDRHDGAASQ